MATETPKVKLKLLIDTKKRRVLFAEAGKDFVDFLFSILSLPLGTVTRMLTMKTKVGSLGNIYQSVKNMNPTYIVPDRRKDDLLNPVVTAPYPNKITPLMLPDVKTSMPRVYYRCSRHYYEKCFDNISDDETKLCPSCGSTMGRQVKVMESPEKVLSMSKVGFVKDIVTYMVMDDLMVAPASSFSGINALHNLNVKDLDALEEKMVDLGMEEGLKLLDASLKSKRVLTDAFLKKNPVKSELDQ